MKLEQLKNILNETSKFPYLISNLTNIYYLTGFEGSYAQLIIDPEKSFFITDSRYVEYAESIIPNPIEIIQEKNNLTDLIINILENLNRKSLYIERSISLENYLTLKNKLKNVELLPGGGEVESLRIVKDENEIEKIKKAVFLADECFNHLLKIIKPGILEWDVAIEIEYFYRKNGCRRSSFDTIVASGSGSSMPHYNTSMNKKIKTNDIIMIDMGCLYNGYNSDLTRTVFVGSITPEFKKIYGIVRAAQEQAIYSVKPGLTAEDLDKIARDIISKEGHGQEFGHSLGHGLGLEIHENPRIKEGNDFKLMENTIFTIEPGIYIQGKGGVRIEDVVIVTENGYENLTSASKEIIIL